jgi:hypothetical protein
MLSLLNKVSQQKYTQTLLQIQAGIGTLTGGAITQPSRRQAAYQLG